MEKIKKKLLLVFPHELIRDLFKSNSDVIFLDARGWWILDKINSTRRLIEFNCVKVDYAEEHHFASVLKRIDWWAPIWHRWVTHADQFELLKRDALMHILNVKAGIKLFEVSNAIFHTGVSHHIDTSCIEIACSESNVPQIYLYQSYFGGRLLPMIQDRSISDRKPLGEKISTYDTTTEILNLRVNKVPRSKRSVVVNTSNPNKGYGYAAYRIYRDEVRSIIVNKVKRLIGVKRIEDYPVGIEHRSKLVDNIRLIRQQKKALNFYLKNCLSGKEIQKTLENQKLIPLIGAHYQPEATSFPEGGDWSNHVDVVLKLRSLQFIGDIAYKEHPTSWTFYEPIVRSTKVGMYRSVSYYQQLLDLGCKFLPPDYQINMKSEKTSWFLPISITGSICIERSLMGLPSIYSGHPLYKGLPGTFPMDEISNFDQFSELVKKNDMFSGDEAVEHLKKIYNFTTITNVLGIGSGKPIADEAMVNTFKDEYTNLVNRFL